MWRMTWCVVLCLAVALFPGEADAALRVGRGIADITGLAAEGALYGYADPTQKARGLHLRQFSRAFVFDNGYKMAAFVVVEATMISQAVHKKVIDDLREPLGGVLNDENVMLSPTHSHSAPGGFHTYWMYQVATPGFINDTFNSLVDGIVSSIVRAHADLQEAEILANANLLIDATENRSPYAYYYNPPQEIVKYQYNLDKLMTVLRINNYQSGAPMGMISFFAVHTTSMKNYNHLVSTDNKGYAAQMMERYLNPGKLPGKGDVIAAFTQTSEGDASPNTDGSRCEETNEYCYTNTSTCPQWPHDPRKCTGRGPAGEQFADTRIIGDKQFQTARVLYEYAEDVLGDEIDFRFQWVNMSDVDVLDSNNNPTKTCRPSMGYSFAAGATDGPGIPPFTQAMLEPIANISDIIDAVFNMSDQLIACHAPKPILLPTGEIEKPWAWQPEIVPVQILRIGKLFLVGVPAEVCTMAGRRIENAVKEILLASGLPADIRVIIVAMANAYSSYLVTYEEYQVQRYEGASTIFGPHTLQAYTLQFQRLARAMAEGDSLELGTPPPDLLGLPSDSLGIIKRDVPPTGMTYGDITEDVDGQYARGETASAMFVAGNPRNQRMNDRNYLEVQKKVNEDWVVEATDANWETKFLYSTSCDEGRNETSCTNVSQMSNATITWDIPAIQELGTYRLVYYGWARASAINIVPFVGTSSEFEVVPAPVYGNWMDDWLF